MEVDTLLKFITIAIGFYMAWNIGANDVSNAMGTSVGSKALSLKKAVILAAILEFTGAFFLGSRVSVTIQSGIIHSNLFEADPMIFVLGMMSSLISTGIWLHLASFFKLPVSTTHAIIGALVGFGLLIGGFLAINWMHVFFITASWLISPVISGFISYIIFTILQRKIFFTINPVESTKKIVPYFVFCAFLVFSLSLIFQGLSNLHLNLSFSSAVVVSIIIGLIAFFISKLLLKRVKSAHSSPQRCANPQLLVNIEKASKHLQRTQLNSCGNTCEKSKKILSELKELKKTIEEETKFSPIATEYTIVEKTFVHLQLFSAALVAFAHGANDVANAIGPVSAVFQVLRTKVINFQAQISTWVLLLGSLGIVIGLATWGWRVIETIGKKITELTPTRGFSAEFGAAITILFASKLGLPISTTHALVGGVLGVGIARGLAALNLRTLRDIVFSWIITIPICAILSIFIFYLLKLLFL